jgi:FMNH2-dependent dimethyl sulfone monooxygenase
MTSYFGDNTYKFGLFGLNCSGGMTPSQAPNRWRADWDEIVEVAKMADDAGIEFLLPIAKWHGLGGEADFWGHSLETFTQAAGLGALTKRIGSFVTAHVSLLTPAFAAKAIATLDHLTHGRAGLNIVCGWNPDEFAIHGVRLDGEHRYRKGAEWLEIFNRLVAGEPAFDWNGESFHMSGLQSRPTPLQQPHPPIMSAAQSGDGQVFAARYADILFTAMYSESQLADSITRAREQASQNDRTISIYATTQIICRRTKEEAQDYLHY